jgi:exodeoxyribonuclease VII large subunit
MSQSFGFSNENTNINQSESNGTRQLVFNVEQLNLQVKQILENQVGAVWLQAEISNFKPHSSGHFYFSLKDSKSQISAIMFRGHNARLKFKPHDGLEVIVKGRISVYEPRGTYNIVCESMEPVGAGALQRQFEQLKEKLKKEGLFEASRKKEIPHYPRHVAVVTSPTGAAIQDILNIMGRRARNVQLTVVPALVQGPAAATSLCESFLSAQKLNPDVIIIGRGGGSIEDLWCFNDENLARLIASCEIPVISAVGHEIDFTICDFVSDLRAPTPSAAAELVAKSSIEISQKLTQFDRLLANSIQKMIKLKQQSLNLNTKRLVDPKRKLHDFALRNDELLTRLEQAVYANILHLKKDIQILEKKLVKPSEIIFKYKSRIEKIDIRALQVIHNKLSREKSKLENNMSVLNSLSPLAVVDRGYSITSSKGKVVKSVNSVQTGDVLEILVSDGNISAQVKNISKKLKSEN